MTDPDQLNAMRKLHEIGGWVSTSEVLYHCGELGVLDLIDAEGAGLVEIRTDGDVFYSLTAKGQKALSSSPEGRSVLRPCPGGASPRGGRSGSRRGEPSRGFDCCWAGA